MISQEEFDAICASRDENQREAAMKFAHQTLANDAREWQQLSMESMRQGTRTFPMFYLYLAEKHSFNEQDNLFWSLGRCVCCERHQGSAPLSMYTDECTPPPPENCHRGCSCACRSYRRTLKSCSVGVQI